RTPGRDPRLLSRRYRCNALRRSTHAPTTYHPAPRARGRGGRSAPSPDRRTPAPAPSPPTPPPAHHDPRPTDRPRSTPRRRPAHPRLAYPPSKQMGVTEFPATAPGPGRTDAAAAAGCDDHGAMDLLTL